MKTINTQSLMAQSEVEFGTSGLRGLVEKMTDEVCYVNTQAFIQHIMNQASKPTAIVVAGDLRKSTPRIMNAVMKAIKDMGIIAINTGFIPSPAVTLYGIKKQIPSIMVTGSHIPDDRNGIKFNLSIGEITKTDEIGIKKQTIKYDDLFDEQGYFKQLFQLDEIVPNARQYYIQRYTQLFTSTSLSSYRIGVYQHSGVARDILSEILKGLGAEVIHLGRSEEFIPVDTEAIREEDSQLAKKWVQEHKLDTLVSTDGDADRPLISDEQGNWLRGDSAGVLCAQYLGINHLSTPVSCNSNVELSQCFKTVSRTKIGSPYVIEGMQKFETEEQKRIGGYEANGGFLLQDKIDISDNSGSINDDKNELEPLPTRDAVIVILSIIMAAKKNKSNISGLLKTLPERYTYSNRLKGIPKQKSNQLLKQFIQSDDLTNHQTINSFFNQEYGQVASVNTTDGVRISFDSDVIIHIRPSGNAPELRCYTEASTIEEAIQINNKVLVKIQQKID